MWRTARRAAGFLLGGILMASCDGPQQAGAMATELAQKLSDLFDTCMPARIEEPFDSRTQRAIDWDQAECKAQGEDVLAETRT